MPDVPVRALAFHLFLTTYRSRHFPPPPQPRPLIPSRSIGRSLEDLLFPQCYVFFSASSPLLLVSVVFSLLSFSSLTARVDRSSASLSPSSFASVPSTFFDFSSFSSALFTHSSNVVLKLVALSTFPKRIQRVSAFASPSAKSAGVLQSSAFSLLLWFCMSMCGSMVWLRQILSV